MRPARISLRFAFAALLLGAPRAAARAEGEAPSPAVVAADWTPATFERARREGRILVVEVSAAWCHWCHVMERETYADPRVVRRLGERFLRVRVDADARPDLAERYAEYHWPATVFLTPDAKTVTALRGYRGPDEFLRVLDEVEAAVREGRVLIDPSPPGGGVAAPGADLLPPLRARLRAELARRWDPVAGGFGLGQKYPYAPAVLATLRAEEVEARGRALRTLEGFEALVDPVWGGMYQYSEGGVWTSPHFEKIASVNGGALSAFSAGYRATGDRRWLDDAYAVRRYVVGTLRSASGAFFTSQDADVEARDAGGAIDARAYFALGDAARRRIGAPRLDRAIYAQENGWLVEGLCDLCRASGDEAVRAEAEAAARAVLATHRDDSGALRHAAGDGAILHLGDQAAFGRALVALSDATGDGAYVAEAAALADAMLARLLDREGGGFFGQTEDPAAVGDFRRRVKPFEGNAAAARFLLALHAATGKGAYRTEALRAIASVAAPALSARFGRRCAALLLAVEEASRPWAHATLVAADDDPVAARLWGALRALDDPLLVRERVAPGVTSTSGTTYPASPAPAVYVCGDGRCSTAVRRPDDLASAVRVLRAR